MTWLLIVLAAAVGLPLFALGAACVIQGWREGGLVEMTAGDTIFLPPRKPAPPSRQEVKRLAQALARDRAPSSTAP